MTHTFSINAVFVHGWETYKKDPWFYSGVTLCLTLFSFIVNILTSPANGIALLGLLISFAASTIVSIAYARLALSAEGGAHVGWDGLWAPEYFFNMLGATVLQALAILVGLVLLVIPGIVVALMLCLTQLSVVDKKLTPVAAIKESYRLTKSHLVELALLALALLVLNLIGTVLLLVGLLVTIPITLIIVAHVYKKLSALQEPLVVAGASTPL